MIGVSGYYTAFKRTILKNAFSSFLEFDLIRGYRIYHVMFIPIFFTRVFMLYNWETGRGYEIDYNLQKLLEACKDDPKEYNKAIKLFKITDFEAMRKQRQEILEVENDENFLRFIKGIGFILIFILIIWLGINFL